MKKKMIGAMLIIGVSCVFGNGICPQPKSTGIKCAGTQDPLCLNGCVKITSDGTTTSDCSGPNNVYECKTGNGTAGITTTQYGMLDAKGQPTTTKETCDHCTTSPTGLPQDSKVACSSAYQGDEVQQCETPPGNGSE
jgi:hypothetical protein